MLNTSLKNIIIYALLASILFVQEQVLAFLPNIQLTFLLIIVYSKVLKPKESIIIIIIHVLLDNLLNGSLTLFILLPMLIGYLLIPLFTNTLLKNVKKPLFLALYGVLASILYSLCFVVSNWIFLPINIKAYIVADIPFTLILSVSNFPAILFLYKPLSQFLTKVLYN